MTESKSIDDKTELLRDRVAGALFGILIGDAFAAPAHWFYDVAELKRVHGKITKYVASPTHISGSIMGKSNTGGGGRGSDEGKLIGDVIFKGKHRFWKAGTSYFYHNLLKSGENTVEGVLSRVVTRGLTEKKQLDSNDLRERYVAFLTAENSHNDTYANTYHRMFFANWVQKKPLSACPDNDGHNVDAIDAMTNVVPCALLALQQGPEAVEAAAKASVSLFRKTSVLQGYAAVFASMLVCAVRGDDVKSIVKDAAKAAGFDLERSLKFPDPMTACYITSSFASLLHFAYKYADSFEEALIASTNVGGENVSRGSCLCALLGAAKGLSALPSHLVKGLRAHDEAKREIDAFCDLILPLRADPASAPAATEKAAKPAAEAGNNKAASAGSPETQASAGTGSGVAVEAKSS